MTDKKKAKIKADPPELSEEDLEGAQGGLSLQQSSPLMKVREAALSAPDKLLKPRTTR